jgi:hypothetical protein
MYAVVAERRAFFLQENGHKTKSAPVRFERYCWESHPLVFFQTEQDFPF